MGLDCPLSLTWTRSHAHPRPPAPPAFPGSGLEGERQSSGKPHLQAARAGFPRGTGFLRGDNKRANCFPPTSRLDLSRALPFRGGPRGSSEKGLARNSFPPSQPAIDPAPCSSSPTSTPGRSPAPTRSQQLVSTQGSPRLSRPPGTARGAPEVRLGGGPRGAPAWRAQTPTAGDSSPSAPGQGHEVLVPELGRLALLAPRWEARGPPASRRAFFQLSPLTCSSEVDF